MVSPALYRCPDRLGGPLGQSQETMRAPDSNLDLQPPSSPSNPHADPSLGATQAGSLWRVLLKGCPEERALFFFLLLFFFGASSSKPMPRCPPTFEQG